MPRPADSDGQLTGDYDFSIAIGGISGSVELPAFIFDKLTVPTLNGFNLAYLNARVCVHDIVILAKLPASLQLLTGICGCNFGYSQYRTAGRGQ